MAGSGQLGFDQKHHMEEFDYDEIASKAVIININGKLVCKEYNIAEDRYLCLKLCNRDKSDEDKHIYVLDGVKILGIVVKVIYSVDEQKEIGVYQKVVGLYREYN